MQLSAILRRAAQVNPMGTATIFKDACAEAVDRFKPEAIIVGASCTAELIQDDPGGLAEALLEATRVVRHEGVAAARRRREELRPRGGGRREDLPAAVAGAREEVMQAG